eukprot:TRINITY_DN7839_c0_g1_i2.p3 TRINITY_DN7839_c0_g1~~TRINITY_DN7839_c0_g1_i2.p3  ORF type:complete len:122 (+),score=7.41 TRINITY_DN7839_c0_g1_i2:131-496(+)
MYISTAVFWFCFYLFIYLNYFQGTNSSKCFFQFSLMQFPLCFFFPIVLMIVQVKESYDFLGKRKECFEVGWRDGLGIISFLIYDFYLHVLSRNKFILEWYFIFVSCSMLCVGEGGESQVKL